MSRSGSPPSISRGNTKPSGRTPAMRNAKIRPPARISRASGRARADRLPSAAATGHDSRASGEPAQLGLAARFSKSSAENPPRSGFTPRTSRKARSTVAITVAMPSIGYSSARAPITVGISSGTAATQESVSCRETAGRSPGLRRAACRHEARRAVRADGNGRGVKSVRSTTAKATTRASCRR